MLKNTLKYLFGLYGYEVRKVPKFHRLAFQDQYSIFRNKEVNVILDIGAHVGETLIKYDNLFPNAKIFCFEPSPGAFRYLLKCYNHLSNVNFYDYAIADKPGYLELYLNNMSDYDATNSLLPLTQEAVNNLGFNHSIPNKIEVKVSTLDNFVNEQKISKISILKMDIQGCELLALNGGIQLLSNQAIDLIYTEVLFSESYKEQAFFHEIVDFLRGFNYKLYGLYEPYYTPKGLLSYSDAIFVSSSIEESLDSLEFSLF